MAATKRSPRCTSSSRDCTPRITSTSGICATGLKKCRPIRRPGSAQPLGDLLDHDRGGVGRQHRARLELALDVDLNSFCLISSFSTIASMTTSARRDAVALGIGDEARLGGIAQRLGLELAREQLALRGDALGDLLGATRPAATPPCRGDAPAGDVGAHHAGADHVHAQRLQAELLAAPGPSASPTARTRGADCATVRHHQRREGARLGGLHRLVVAAVRLEQIDQPEGRRIVVLARLLGGLGAHALGEQPARRPLGQQPLGEAGAASTCACAAPPCAPPSGSCAATVARAHRRGPCRARRRRDII